MARRARRRGTSARHMAWVRSFRKNRRHRRGRRNPFPVAGIALNPRRRRRHRSNPRRRHYRRNPSMRGILGGLPPVQSVLFAGVGLVGTPILEGVLNPILPVSITSNTFGKYAVRIGSVLGLTWLTKAVLGGARARMVGLGGGVYVLTTALREFAPGLIPGMSAYTAPALAAYTPATGRNFRTLGAVGPGQTVGSPLMMSRARFGNR